MAYDVALKSDPSPMPLAPAILILLHKKKRAAFIGYTSNARGRAGVLTSMVRHRTKSHRNNLRDLPDGDAKDFVLLAYNIGLDKRQADDKVEKLRAKFERDGYKLFGGTRSAVPKVVLNGRRMTLIDALLEVKSKVAYQTAYRRIQRGWTVKEAIE